MEHAKRFRALLADLGLKHPDAAKLLHVSLRTLQNWLTGRHAVPYATLKLLRLMRYMELPGKDWAGWSFSRGQLVTPEGRMISGKDGAWWSLLVRQARCFHAMYQRSGQLERALMELTAVSKTSVAASVGPLAMAAGSAVIRDEGGPGTGGTQRGGRDVPGSEADRAAQPPANLFIAHFRTEENVIAAKLPSAAIKTVAFPSFNFTLQKGGVYGYRQPAT
jgi:Phage protein